MLLDLPGVQPGAAALRVWRLKYLRILRPANTSTPSRLATTHGTVGP